MDFELKITEEDIYDHAKADALVGQRIILGNSDEMLVKEHILYHFFMIRQDGSFHMRNAKFILEELQRKEDDKNRLNNLKKLFDKQYLKDTKWSTSGQIEYYANLVGTGSAGVNTLLDTRSLVFDFNSVDGDGSFGIQVAGYSPTGSILSRLETEDFIRISEDDIREYALNEFKTKFEKLLSLDNQIYYNKTEKNGAVSITFWNSNSDHAFLLQGFYPPDSWGKEVFTLDKGVVKTYPDANNSGVAQSGRRASWGRKITMSKNAQLVDKSVLLDPIYEFMVEKIDFLFNAKKD
jgi:hypothetical protein